MSFNLLYISHSCDALLGSQYSTNIAATGSNWLIWLLFLPFVYSKCVRFYFGINEWKKKRSRKTSKFKLFLNRSCDLFSLLDVCARALLHRYYYFYRTVFGFFASFFSLRFPTHKYRHRMDLVVHCTLNAIVLSAKIWSALLAPFIIFIQIETKSFLQTMKNETLLNTPNEWKSKESNQMNKQSCFSYGKWILFTDSAQITKKKKSTRIKKTNKHTLNQTPNQMNECNKVDIVPLFWVVSHKNFCKPCANRFPDLSVFDSID